VCDKINTQYRNFGIVVRQSQDCRQILCESGGVAKQVGSRGDDVSARETVVRACDSRVRRRLIYTSRDSQVRVTMPLTAAATRPPRATVGYYLLHFQGTHVRRSLCIAPATERPRAHHNTARRQRTGMFSVGDKK